MISDIEKGLKAPGRTGSREKMFISADIMMMFPIVLVIVWLFHNGLVKPVEPRALPKTPWTRS